MIKHPSGSLYEATLEKLRTSHKSLVVIAQETNLPFYWLKKVKSGEIRQPSVNRTQRLYEYLTGKTLEC